ncbi:MAG TPA: methylmalonyl-CoA mutase family protein [Candidatus Sulfotelmatobacter sp.]|nr:methylmalonyl-CoA mutase family protein [Candidatus Sulfotelmatobacter sp.]
MTGRLGQPGEFPFTRGVYRDMYRSRLWTMRQYAGFGTAEESNRRYRYLLSQGTTGLSVAFDLPTQMGYDSDHPMAAGEVGRVGVAVSSLADMETLFRDIPLQDVSTSMTINSTAAILLALYALVARRQGADTSKLSGTIQNDILKEYIARGTYIYPPRPAMRIITDVFAWAGREMPEWNTISISGYHIREAGSDGGLDIRDGVGESEGHFLDRGGTGFANVVTADRDGVPLGHLTPRPGKHVGDDAQGRPRRVDVGAARDVFLEDVVLDGAREIAPVRSLPLGDQRVQGEQDGRGRVDGHGGRDGLERNALEEGFHVGQGRNRHTDASDFPGRHGVIGIEPHLGGQVEGYREAGGALGQQVVITAVTILGGAEPGVLAHGPEAAPVHVGVDAPRERESPGLAQAIVHERDILRAFRNDATANQAIISVMGAARSSLAPS